MFIPHKVFPVAVSGMITLPVSAQMYQAMVQQQIPNSDGTVCLTPMQVPNFVPNNNLCSEGNLNSTYIMTSNNRNINTMPTQSVINKCHMKLTQSQLVSNHSNSKHRQTKKKPISQTNKVVDLLSSVYPSLSPTSSNNNKKSVENKNLKPTTCRIKTKYSTSKKCNDSIILE